MSACQLAAVSLVVIPLLLAATPSRAAPSFGNVAGRWCIAGGTMTISQQRVVFVPKISGMTLTLNVRQVAYTDNTIQVFFKMNAERLGYYIFSNFGSGSMQVLGPVGTRTLQRC